MRIVHCSDLHLDSKMQSNLDNFKAKERRDEILITFQEMVKIAASNDVRIILIAGDLFDKKQVTQKAKNIVLDCINSNKQIDFIYLKGNHDEGTFLEEEENIPENLKLFSKDKWTKYQYGKVVIAGIEFGQLNEYEIYNTLMLDKNDINIVTLHGQESNYEQKDKTDIINLQELKNKNIDYLALGHIHSYKLDKLDPRGVYCYPGCLEGRGFDECGEKGFVLLDIDEESGKIFSQFVPFAKRKLYEVKVDITDTLTTTDVEKKIDESIQGIGNENLLKIVLTGKVSVNSERDIDYLVKKYLLNYYFVKIYDETVLKINYMDYEKDISLKGEFIRLVLGEEISEEEKKEIITTGLKALSKEEVN